MVSSNCCVKDCKTGQKGDRRKKKISGEKCLSLFSVPSDKTLFERWKSVIPMTKGELLPSSRVCELHFDEEDIVRCFTTKLPDGTIHKLLRQVPQLRKGAVPNFREKIIEKGNSVTPNCERELPSSDYQVQFHNDDIARFNSNEFSPGAIEEIDQQIFSLNEGAVQNFGMQQERMREIFEPTVKTKSLCYLTVGEIKVPNQWWSVLCTPDFLLCTKWNASAICERKVIIRDGLNVKLFLKDHEIFQEDDLKLSSIAEISSLLCKVDRYHICPGIEKFKEKCLKYQKKITDGRKSLWCINCRRERKLLSDRQRAVSSAGMTLQERKEAKIKADKRRLINVLNQNLRLRKKVERLKRRVKILMHKRMPFDYDSTIKDLDVASDIDDIENDSDDVENNINMESDSDDFENDIDMESNNAAQFFKNTTYVSSDPKKAKNAHPLNSYPHKVGNATHVSSYPEKSVNASHFNSFPHIVENTPPFSSNALMVGNATNVSVDAHQVGNATNISADAHQVGNATNISADSHQVGNATNASAHQVGNAIHVVSDANRIGNVIQNQTVIAEIFTSGADKVENAICISSAGILENAFSIATNLDKIENVTQNQTVIAEILLS